jgi:hypothetical protein
MAPFTALRAAAPVRNDYNIDEAGCVDIASFQVKVQHWHKFNIAAVSLPQAEVGVTNRACF